ncbi:dehypoxanthine futalosine cyclase [Granulicella arctica]|uniref:dehypoxanthine futalosine cyclase n=1 Tax=Granulicella arctica TaxID=940613 RepID=UPI0021DF7244|nr:dehypoxanthine futalosine cyclase [Granulicella arctica]
MGITRQQALDASRSDDLIGIGMEADAVRRRLHPEGVVSYVIDRTLCCTAEDLDGKVKEAVDLNVTGLNLHGDLPTLAAWESLLATLRTRQPALWRHGLSATQIVALAFQENLTLRDALVRLQTAGLQSLTGADAGILDEAVATGTRCTPVEWLAVHREAHRLGMPSTAAMLFGAGETVEHRINHLEALNDLQQETNGFIAFIPVAFQPAAAGIRGFEEATAVEYLRTLSIARIVLDTIPNLQADWATQGLKVLQMAIRFGANDVGSTMPTETILTPDRTTEEDLRRVIREASLKPVQRDTVYRTMFLG